MGGSAETYETLCHKKADYERCINGLHLLRNHDIDVKLNVSVVKKNKMDFDAILSEARNLGIPIEVNSYMFPALRKECNGSRDVDLERLLPKDAASYNQEYMKYKNGVSYFDYVRNSLSMMEKLPSTFESIGLDCRAGSSSLWINWRHIMSPCVFLEEPAVNLRDTTVFDAWNIIVRKVRRLFKHEECAGCQLQPICQVCYAAANYEKMVRGNLDYLCEMSKTEKEILENNK